MSDEMNEQFRACVNTADFTNDNDIEQQVMSVMISDVSNDIDVSYRWGDDNMNIIMIASCYNKIELLKLVLSKYEAVVSNIIDDCDCNGDTAIMIASDRGYDAAVYFLLCQNAKVNIQDNNNLTALHYASINGHTSIVELLLSKGALVDIQDKNYFTSLHFGCQSAFVMTAKVLVRYGSSLEITNGDGQTALEYINDESDKNLLKVQEGMFRKWISTVNFVIVLCHFNIKIDKSKEGTNRTVFYFQLKNIVMNETDNAEPRRSRPREEPQVIGAVLDIIGICQIICNYL
jgi:ankyrin repeat protein